MNPEQALNKILIQAKLALAEYKNPKTSVSGLSITAAQYASFVLSARILADAIGVNLQTAAANVGLEIKN